MDGWSVGHQSDERFDGQTESQMNGCLDRHMVKWMIGLTVGWMDSWSNRRTDAQMDKLTVERTD